MFETRNLAKEIYRLHTHHHRGLHYANDYHQTGSHRLVEQLPDDATWDDLMYEIYVQQAIEAGVIESDAGRLLDAQEGQAKFGHTT